MIRKTVHLFTAARLLSKVLKRLGVRFISNNS